MPLFNPSATVLPSFMDDSTEALHMGHCANDISGSKTKSSRTRISMWRLENMRVKLEHPGKMKSLPAVSEKRGVWMGGERDVFWGQDMRCYGTE